MNNPSKYRDRLSMSALVAAVAAFSLAPSAHGQNRWLRIADHEDEFSEGDADRGRGSWRYGVYVAPTSTFVTSDFRTYNRFGENNVGMDDVWWLAPNGDNGVGSNRMRPSRAQPGDYRFAATGWRSDFVGTVQAEWSFRKTSTAGDGVNFRVLKGSDALHAETISGGDNGFNTSSVQTTVGIDDRISFVVGSRDNSADNDIISFVPQGGSQSTGYFRVRGYIDPAIAGRVVGPMTVNEGSTAMYSIEADVVNYANPSLGTRWRGGALSLSGAVSGTLPINNSAGPGVHRSSVQVAFQQEGQTSVGFGPTPGNAPSWELTSASSVWDYSGVSASLPVTVLNVAPSVGFIQGVSSVLIDQTFTQSVSATDPADPLTYQWTATPDFSIQPPSGSPSIQGTIVNAGDYILQVHVNDGTATVSVPKSIRAYDQIYWLPDAGGNWSGAPKWTESLVPTGNRVTAIIGNAPLTANRTIQVTSPVAIGTVKFASAAGTGYTLQGTSAITLSGPLALTFGAAGGNHVVDLPVTITKSANIDVGGGTSLTFRQPVSAAGQTFVKSGQGLAEFHEIRAGAATFAGGQTRLLNASGGSIFTSVSLTGGASMDIGRSALIVDFAGTSPGQAVRSLITSGTVFSNQTGDRMTVGWVDSSQRTFSSTIPMFAGISIDNSAVVVRFTLKGDTDLNRVVEFADLLMLAQHYRDVDAEWYNGDFDYDHDVDFDDLLVLAQNYERPFALMDAAQLESHLSAPFAAEWRLAVSMVPEPTWALGLLASCLNRRRVEWRSR